MFDSKNRFSNRVDDYNKYRPSYPSGVLQTLKSEFHLNADHIIADVGSGTGISSQIFLENGNKVFAVEPNRDMRAQAEKNLSVYPNFLSIAGDSENTTLPPVTVDFVVVAQAFHWFAVEPTSKEFARIKKPEAPVVILFNDRLTSGSEFAERYEELMNRFGMDYQDVKHKNRAHQEQRYAQFFKSYHRFEFPYSQVLDFNSLLGRTKSSSYIPKADHPSYKLMYAELQKIFFDCSSDGSTEKEIDGVIKMKYTTQMLCGRELLSFE